MDKILATSQDYLWEWINACKELCDSWMESAIGTEIKTELLNSAVGFTQSAANNWVLRFQAEQHPPPLQTKGQTWPIFVPSGLFGKRATSKLHHA